MDITSIISSVSNGFIKDEFVKKGTFIKRRKNGREQLERYVGGFSVVFPFTVNNKKIRFGLGTIKNVGIININPPIVGVPFFSLI